MFATSSCTTKSTIAKLLREPSGDGRMDVMHSVAMNRSSGLRDRFARESNAASDEAV